MIIKVNGMRSMQNIRAVTELGIRHIGMVFQKESPRNVTMIPTHAGIIPDRVKTSSASSSAASTSSRSIIKTGIFSDEMAQNIITRVVNFRLNMIQFDGNEQPTFIRNLRHTLDPSVFGDSEEARPISAGIKFIKTIRIDCQEDVDAWKQFDDCIDYFIFDAKGNNADSSSNKFDLSLLDAYQGGKPFLIAGIGVDDAERIRTFHHPQFAGIDLSTSFESEPSVIDTEKLGQFIKDIS